MIRPSNTLVGFLNFLILLASVPILGAGIWLAHRSSTNCEKFLERPLIAVGVFLILVSLTGLIGACCRVYWLLWFYLLVMFLLIVLLFGFTVFAFVVTNKGAGEALSGRGYKEYRLGDYSDWLQKRVNNSNNWSKIKSCLMDSKVCSGFASKYVKDTVNEFYLENLNAIQSGCCKPPDSCNFTYVRPTVWTDTATLDSTDPDCLTWSNEGSASLCLNCQSCKAGVVDEIKGDWKKVAIVNIVVLVVIIIVYSIGCCAFRNNREDDAFRGWKRGS